MANFHFKAEYSDQDALRRFAEAVDVITYEFENIPPEALDLLEPLVPCARGARPCASARTG